MSNWVGASALVLVRCASPASTVRESQEKGAVQMEEQQVKVESVSTVPETALRVPHGQERIVTQAERVEMETLLQQPRPSGSVPAACEEIGQ